MDIIFNIKYVEMGCVTCVTFASTQHNLFIKCIRWVESSQPDLLTGRVKVKKSWHSY